MSLESDSMRDRFFNPNEFGSEFITSPGAISFNGIFDNGYTDADSVSTASASVLTKFSNVAAASLVIDLTITKVDTGISYKIREFKPDGEGLVTLTLEKQ